VRALILIILIIAVDFQENGNEYRQSTWPSGTNIQVNRTQTATPPVVGTFDIIAGGGERIKSE
jgi:hypothetical protein